MKYFGTISDFFFLLTPEFFSCSSYQLSPCLWQKAASTILCIWAGATWKCKGTFEQIGTIPKGYLLWCMKQSSAGWWPKPLMCMGGGGGGGTWLGTCCQVRQQVGFVTSGCASHAWDVAAGAGASGSGAWASRWVRETRRLCLSAECNLCQSHVKAFCSKWE